MEQTILARHDLHEATIRHHRTDSSVVNLANLRNGNDSADLADGLVDAILVRSTYLNLTHAVGLVDGYRSTRLLLNLLDNLSARADYGSDELLRNIECLDAWHLWLQFGTWLSDSVGELAQDVLATFLGLHKSLLKDVEAQSVTLDIHLCGSQSVLRTSGLEVHVAQVVLVAEDIAQYSILVLARVLDKTHCDTGYRLLHRNTGIHQSQGSGTYRRH